MVPSGRPFPTVSASGLATLQQPGWGPFSFSLNKADTNPFWQPGKRIGVGSLGLLNPLIPRLRQRARPERQPAPGVDQPGRRPAHAAERRQRQLGLRQLRSGRHRHHRRASRSGFIQHTGDMCGNVPCGAGMPSWSHDGSEDRLRVDQRRAQRAVQPGEPERGAGRPARRRRTRMRSALPGMTNLWTRSVQQRERRRRARRSTGAATTQAEEYLPGAVARRLDGGVHAACPAGESMYANSHAEIYGRSDRRRHGDAR